MIGSQNFYILVLILLSASVLIEKFLPIHRVIAFRGMLISQICMVCISEFIFHRMGQINIDGDELFLLTSIIYIIFLIKIYFYSFFICTHIGIEENKLNKLRHVYDIILSIGLLVALYNFYSHHLFYIGSNGYHRGEFFYVTYIYYFIYLGIALFFMIRNYKKMIIRDIISVICYIFVISIDMIIRYINPNVYHIKPLAIIALLMAYILFEEPMNYRDGYVKLFDKNALDLYVREKIGKDNLSLIFMSIKQYFDRREILGDDVIKEIEIDISNFLKTNITGRYIFYIDNGTFVISNPKGKDSWKDITKIRDRFLKPFSTSEGDIFLEVNITETSETYRFNDASELIQIMRDDLSLKDKEDVDDSIILTHARIERSRKRFHVKKILQNLEEDNRLLVYLQPIVEAKTKRLVGAEALARLRDDDGSIIYPDSFIPCAEENGSITTLGLEVIKQTAAFLRDYNDIVPLDWINVNISPLQCQDPNLDIKIKSVVSKYKLDKNKMHIEITEQAFSNQKLLSLFMQSMLDDGYQFVADDFGSGYNNIEMILNHPFRNVKFDKETTWNGLIRYPEVIKGLIDIFKNSGYFITAEGVETKEMVDTLTEMGATYLQGYYYSKPIPMEDFVSKYKSM